MENIHAHALSSIGPIVALEVGPIRKTLNSRYDDLKTGRSEVAEGDRELVVSVGKLKGPTRSKLKEVTLTFASWNQIAAGLRQLDRLGRFVGDASSEWL